MVTPKVLVKSEVFWTDDEVEIMLKMLREGHTRISIGGTLNKTADAVRAKLYRMRRRDER